MKFEGQVNKLYNEIKGKDDLISKLENSIRDLQEKLETLVISQDKDCSNSQNSSKYEKGDNLTRIKGIGQGYERTLKALDVTTYAQIAAWTEEDLDYYAKKIKAKPSRIRKQGWIESAKALLPPEPLDTPES